MTRIEIRFPIGTKLEIDVDIQVIEYEPNCDVTSMHFIIPQNIRRIMARVHKLEDARFDYSLPNFIKEKMVNNEQ